MEGGKGLRSLFRYLEFGVRLHLEDFANLTGVVLVVFLPFAVVSIVLHPPLRELIQGGGNLFVLLPRVILSQLLMRVAQAFVFILLILKLEAHLRGEGNIWDIGGALGRFGRVVRVDIAYVFGIQVLGLFVLWTGVMVLSVFFGQSPIVLPLAVTIAGVLTIGPAIRFYFCTFSALIHNTDFVASFRTSAELSSGAERMVVLIVMTFLVAWFIVMRIFQGFFGDGLFGQIVVQAGVMAFSIPYYFATYRLYLDLSLEDSRRAAMKDPEEPPSGGSAPDDDLSRLE
ncbi:MAG: hypothetical protein O2807_08915 [bacterium]|nr:hypothetical protein [bacterium]